MLQYVELISLNTLYQSVVEHLIITTGGFYSFESSGDIKRLNLSKKYVPGYLEIERIQEEPQRIGTMEMAKVMKKEGEPVEKISKYTGLSTKEIETL